MDRTTAEATEKGSRIETSRKRALGRFRRRWYCQILKDSRKRGKSWQVMGN
jgi:hypothetical protein